MTPDTDLSNDDRHTIVDIGMLGSALTGLPLISEREYKAPDEPASPVSYTHLDVYKRQVHRLVRPKIFGTVFVLPAGCRHFGPILLHGYFDIWIVLIIL